MCLASTLAQQPWESNAGEEKREARGRPLQLVPRALVAADSPVLRWPPQPQARLCAASEKDPCAAWSVGWSWRRVTFVPF